MKTLGKKLLSLGLAALMAASLAACSGGGQTSGTNSGTNSGTESGGAESQQTNFEIFAGVSASPSKTSASSMVNTVEDLSTAATRLTSPVCRARK